MPTSVGVVYGQVVARFTPCIPCMIFAIFCMKEEAVPTVVHGEAANFLLRAASPVLIPANSRKEEYVLFGDTQRVPVEHLTSQLVVEVPSAVNAALLMVVGV